MHCRGSRAHTHIQQPMIKLLIGFMLCFFHVFLIPALPSARAQLPATFVLPPGTAFQAFGVGLLGSRLPVLSSALCTVPLKAQHPWVPALQRSCIPAGLLLGVCPSLPAVLQCCCACWLWGCCLILAVQAQSLLFPRASHAVHGALLWFKTQDGWSQFSKRKIFSISQSCYVQLLVMFCFFLNHQIITSTVILLLQFPSIVL